MPKVAYLLVIFLTLFVPLAHAGPTDPQPLSAPVTATIPSHATQGDTTPPTVPILLRPFDGTITSNGQSEFSWKQSTDPNGNTVIYTLYLDGVAKYLGISNLGNSAGIGYTSRIEGGEVRLLPANFISEGSHDWYVVASDLSNNQASSTTWHFVIDTTPPFINLLAVENYQNPSQSLDSIFDIQAPQDVNFVIQTESYSTIYLTIIDENGNSLVTLTSSTDSSGLAYPYYYLNGGKYSVLVTATDRAGLSSSLPEFFLNLYEITIPLPSLPPIIRPPLNLPPVITLLPPPSVPSLPATVARLSTRDSLAYLPCVLLAIALLLLLFIIWRRKYNLTLIDYENSAITYAEIFHSHPKHQGNTKHVLDNLKGRIYIPYLTRYSTLTIRYQGTSTVMSLSRKQSHYLITL